MVKTDFETFLKTDIRIGKILRAEPYPEARNPAYKIWVDFGPEIGEMKTSAQITDNYTIDELPGRLVLGVVNFPPRQIGKFMSEFLVLGASDNKGGIVLLGVDKDVPLGSKMH